MYQGEIMIYSGIGMIVAAVLLFVIVTAIFGIRKKKIIKKIYGEQ